MTTTEESRRQRSGVMQRQPGDTVDQLRRGTVPGWLDTAAAWGWRLLVVAAAVILAGLVVSHLQVVVVPLLIATLIAVVLGPPAAWLTERGWPPLLATWTVILASGLLLTAVGWYLVPQFAERIGELGVTLSQGLADVRAWFVDGPPGLDPAVVENAEEAFVEGLRGLGGRGLLARAELVVEVVTGVLLTLVIAFFYIKDGDRFRSMVAARFPTDLRPRVTESMATAATVLRRYLLGTIVVGLADAVLIGVGVAIVGVPLVVPIMVLTFLAAFFPLVGAIVAGAVATLLALASSGAADALVVLAIAVAVQQLDGDLIAPVVFSRAVRLHPLAILLALTTGAVVAGVIGAFLSVPLLAVVTAVRRTWTGHQVQTT